MSDETPPGEPPDPPPPTAPAEASPAENEPEENVAPAPALTPAPVATPAPAPRPVSAPLDYAMPAARGRRTIPKSAGCLVKMLLGFVLVIPAGYFALMAMSPKARQWATAEDGPTPYKAINQILAIPAQAIGKTKDVVAANDARVGVLDKVIAESEGKKLNPDGTPVSALDAPIDPTTATPTVWATPVEKPLPVLSEIKLGGGLVIASASPPGAPAPSQPFLYWVAGLNISGVLQGSPARIRLNNVLTREGELANPALGITFDHLEPAKKLIVFRDRSGALVTRNY